MYNTWQMTQAKHLGRHAGKTPTILFAFVFLLILGIFSWGLEYKLSLYQTAQTQQLTVPAAKLLSQKERPQTLQELAGIFNDTQQKIFGGGNLPLIGMLCVVFFCTLSLQTARIAPSQVHASSRRQHSYSHYFSFRPPPIF
jgi:hypothetical protein